MAKRLRPLTVTERLSRYVAAHPITSISAALSLLAGLGAAVAQRDNLALTWDHIWYASQYYARNNETTSQLKASVHEQSVYLNALLIREDRKSLADAQQELAAHPDSRTAPAMIENLKAVIARREATLDKASRYGAE